MTVQENAVYGKVPCFIHVFIELVRRGYHAETSLFYYRSRNDKETDFVTRQGAHVESLIQVCYDLSSERTLKREVDSIIECAGELKCSNLIIVTMNEEKVAYRPLVANQPPQCCCSLKLIYRQNLDLISIFLNYPFLIHRDNDQIGAFEFSRTFYDAIYLPQ